MKYKSEITQKLKEILDSQTPEQFQKDWNEIKELGLSGPSFSDIIDCSTEKTYIYSFKYNSCIFESGDETISLHFTEDGANYAMQQHKNRKLEEHKNMFGEDWPNYTNFGEFEKWFIEKTEILD